MKNLYAKKLVRDLTQEGDDMKQFRSRLFNGFGLGAGLLAMTVACSAGAAGFDVATLRVDKQGVYEVGISELAAEGIDLRGVSLSRLGMRSAAGTIPLDILDDGNGVADDGDALRFIGEGVDTLYTNQRVYTLKLDDGIERMATHDEPIPGGASAPSYMAELRYAPQSVYALTSPTDDPWYALRLLAYNAPAEQSVNLVLDNFVAGSTAPRLTVKLWGESDLEGAADDHHAEVYINNNKVADASFDGVSAYQVEAVLSSQLSAENARITVRLPADTGYLFDIVNIDEISLEYPRAFVADGESLVFSSSWPKYRLGGFSSSDLSVYAVQSDGSISRINNTVAGGTCSVAAPLCQAMFGGVEGESTYYAVTDAGLKSAEIELPLAPVNIDVDSEALVIAHPDFIGLPGQPLEAYVSQLDAELPGDVGLIDVRQIYAQHANGQFGAEAIHAYLKSAYARGARSVVLVGGDVYDYRDYRDTSAVSFIPSLYVATNEIVRFTPSDPKFADIDDDNVPDMVIARLPVRSAGELSAMLAKRNAYLNRSYQDKALFAADVTSELDQFDFAANSEALINAHFGGWNITRAYLDELPVAQANQRVANAINNGLSLTVYSGHSSYDQLSFEGLFNGEDAAGLNNAGSPTIITQWGCWNTYNVNPETESMSHQFLLDGEHGAAAVLGSSVVAKATAEQDLADMFYAELVKGKSLGQALLDAKQAYAAEKGGDLDILLGITEMGFPHLTVN